MNQAKDSLPTASLAVYTDNIYYHSIAPISSTDTLGSMFPQTSLAGLSYVNQLYLPPIVIPTSKNTAKPIMTDNFVFFTTDQTSPSISIVPTPTLYERRDPLSNETKIPYNHQAIIVNTRSEGNTQREQDTTLYPTESVPQQLVSPEAIRSAQVEEKEEALGQHPFSAYSSFLSMKHSHEQQRFTHTRNTTLPILTIPIDHRSPSSMTQSSTPSPSPPTCSSSSTFTATTAAAITTTNNLLPPPIPEQKSLHQQTLTPKDQSQGLHETTCAPTKNMAPLDSTLLPPLSNKKRSSSITPKRLKRPPNAYLLFNRDMRRKLLTFDPKLTVSEISKNISDRWKSLTVDERQHYMDAAQELKQDHLNNHPDFMYTRRSKAELAQAKLISKAGKKATISKTTIPLTTQFISTPLSYHHHPATSSSSQVDNLCLNEKALDHRLLFSNQNINSPLFSTNDRTPLLPKKKNGRRRSQVGQHQRDPRGRKKKQHRHPTAPKHPMSGFLFFLGAVRPEVAQQFPGSTVGPISKEISSRWKSMSAKDREPWLLKAEADKARYAKEIQVYTANMKQQQQQQSTHDSQLDEKRLSIQPATLNHGNNKNNSLWIGKQLDDDDTLRNDMNVNDEMMPTIETATTSVVDGGIGIRPSSGLYYSSSLHLLPSSSFTAYDSK